MTFQRQADLRLEYDRCRYGASKMHFRGPFRMPQAIDVAVLGGTETFGKFVSTPFPEILERKLGRPVVNLGAMNAGVDSFFFDPAVVEIAQRARVAVIQVMGAHSVSNAFFTVHPRRNDRLISATPLLRSRFPGIDIADCSFSRHLLLRLQAADPVAFQAVVSDMRKTWVGRMKEFVEKLAMPTILLWISDREPEPGNKAQFDPASGDPLFVNRKMVFQLARHMDGYVEVVRDFSDPDDMNSMVFNQIERGAAACLPGSKIHQVVANALAPVLAPAVGRIVNGPSGGARQGGS